MTNKEDEIIDPVEAVDEVELNAATATASPEEKIRILADKYAVALKGKIDERVSVMKSDDNSHYLIYRVLGISEKEGELIDVYQNKGRFLYKYAGSFLEAAAILCFKEKFPEAQAKLRIPNTIGQRPATFEIDCLIENDAYEIKWRDATTDGDHITKEHTRLKNINNAHYRPIRVMFYYPNREQAIRIQQTLKTLYLGFKGEYYFGDEAWEHIHTKTGIDLKGILIKIAEERNGK
ncbi:MAG: ApaLI family restriction endonuclease [Candidatus Paceibacterota bacterium]|jgi:type II restriction enzyme